MKNRTDFRKTVEIGVDPRLDSNLNSLVESEPARRPKIRNTHTLSQ